MNVGGLRNYITRYIAGVVKRSFDYRILVVGFFLVISSLPFLYYCTLDIEIEKAVKNNTPLNNVLAKHGYNSCNIGEKKIYKNSEYLSRDTIYLVLTAEVFVLLSGILGYFSLQEKEKMLSIIAIIFSLMWLGAFYLFYSWINSPITSYTNVTYNRIYSRENTLICDIYKHYKAKYKGKYQ